MYCRARNWTVLLVAAALVATLPLLSGDAGGTAGGSRPLVRAAASHQRADPAAHRRRELSGAVTLVARHGRIAHLEAHGLMDRESKTPMAKDAMFRIMSMTKPVVGVSILMLMEEGKVRLTDPVSKFIPEFKGLKVAVAQAGRAGGGPAAAPAEAPFYTVPADREITIRDLLTHTSGLMSGDVQQSRGRRRSALKGKESLADYLPRLGSVPLDFQPGTRWAYSAQAGFECWCGRRDGVRAAVRSASPASASSTRWA